MLNICYFLSFWKNKIKNIHFDKEPYSHELQNEWG